MKKRQKERSPKRKKHRGLHGGKDSVIRIEELEKIMAEKGEDVDPETIVSMYMPRRRLKRFGAMLLHLDWVRLLLLGLLAFVSVVFIVAFAQEKMGNFTVNLDRLELYRRGISISEDGDFTKPTARLKATSLKDATNITATDLPDNLDQIEGNHNGDNYVAYTYFVRNAGKIDLGYRAVITMENSSKGAENAVRIAVWKNGERTIYAAPSSKGTPEEGCVNFLKDKTVCEYKEENFQVGNVDKYTIVIWMEGEDPECVDSIIGGSVQFRMDIKALADDKTSLFSKFVRDVKDTLKGNNPISASGTEAPDYYKDTNITWKTRRNQ